ncbi:hypothetical protein JCM19232_4973 [Vibrio ishigakensis]|uniref:Uncharacterized protein n=1 Tax=Vibrio ishigakensis TaxID=1481914 RepID=A0A0B8PQR7_9VIBR|nr:hypothetical protein JCM19232_4973 [Vibrio ishigakensis]
MLINEFGAPASLASKPYDIAIDYTLASNSFTSWGIKVIVTLPSTVNGYTLRKAAERVSERVFVTPNTLTLHQSMSSVNSQLQHSYFLSETGCMQGDYP